MKPFASFSEIGVPTGFYFEEIHGPIKIIVNEIEQTNPLCKIPVEARIISREDYEAYINEQGKWLCDPKTGQRVASPLPPGPTREKLLAVIRAERNKRLLACDWTQIPDAPLSTDQGEAWAIYRQALRDFPETCDPANPVWPVAPE